MFIQAMGTKPRGPLCEKIQPELSSETANGENRCDLRKCIHGKISIRDEFNSLSQSGLKSPSHKRASRVLYDNDESSFEQLFRKGTRNDTRKEFTNSHS